MTTNLNGDNGTATNQRNQDDNYIILLYALVNELHQTTYYIMIMCKVQV